MTSPEPEGEAGVTGRGEAAEAYVLGKDIVNTGE